MVVELRLYSCPPKKKCGNLYLQATDWDQTEFHQPGVSLNVKKRQVEPIRMGCHHQSWTLQDFLKTVSLSDLQNEVSLNLDGRC